MLDDDHGDESQEVEYTGKIVNGKREGRGKMIFKYGEYEGEWQNDKMHGYGVLHLKTGNVYEGTFADNKFNGEGKLRWKSGKVYEGTLRSGQMCGRGVMRSEEGVYEGEFFDNEFYGRGTMKFANGDTYSGDWRNGMMWGNGVFTTADGVVYEGAFHKNQKHGKITKTERGAVYSQKYNRDELQVSVKIKSRPSKAGKAVGRFVAKVSALAGIEPKSKDKYSVTSPTRDPSSPFYRAGCTQDDVGLQLDKRAKARKKDNDSSLGTPQSPGMRSERPPPGLIHDDRDSQEGTPKDNNHILDQDRIDAMIPSSLPPCPPPPSASYRLGEMP